MPRVDLFEGRSQSEKRMLNFQSSWVTEWITSRQPGLNRHRECNKGNPVFHVVFINGTTQLSRTALGGCKSEDHIACNI